MFDTHNPDVLTCLSNLSNDEVFTPPKLVNEMLDLLPAEIWSDKSATFLDPVSKTGVFLREIATRLILGLEKEIPDMQERLDHIYRNQLFGIAITELTGLLSRRSVYCSKTANGKYSVCKQFKDEQGNIRSEPIQHTWKKGKCIYCGASEEVYDRDDDLETYAYEFIHTEKPEEIFGMKFDVIVGNPPYQLSDGGHGASASPLYHKFVQQAKKLDPRYLTMIIPARWYAGGKGLNEFRNEMLEDSRLTRLTDYFDATECFPGIDISGGVCYFLWERDGSPPCEITTFRNGQMSTMKRPLLEADGTTFIRFNESISVLRKIQKFGESSMAQKVLQSKPFGFRTFFKGEAKQSDCSVTLFQNGGVGYVPREEVKVNAHLIDQNKVFISTAYGERGAFPYWVLGKPFLGEKGTCCTETYLVIGPFSSKKKCKNAMSYIQSKFFRFLVLLKKNSQHATQRVYTLVPMQDFSEPWTDEKLYAKYGLTEEEIKFIESMVRPME